MTPTDHALALAAEGFHVFPCKSGEKTPAHKGWQAEATRNADAISAWPAECNVGIFCDRFGDERPSGGHDALFILDIDVKDSTQGTADERLAAKVSALKAKFDLPDTRTHRTASGGAHILYRVPTPLRQGADVFKKDGIPGIDTRSRGGYVIAQGSVIGGQSYEIVDDDPVADAPAWVLERFAARPAPSTAATATPVKVDAESAAARGGAYLRALPVSTAGSRNDDGFKAAARLKDFGNDREACRALMRAEWRCEPPCEDDEIDHVVNSAFRYGTEAPGSASPEADFKPIAAQDDAPPPPAHLKTGSDIELATAVLEDLRQEHGDVFHAEGAFWRYDSKKWTPIASNELRRALHTYDGRRCGDQGRVRLSKARIDGVLHEMAVKAERADFFAGIRPGINCESGFIRFGSDGAPTLEAHDGEHRARHVLAATWAPDADWRRPGSLLHRLLHGCFNSDDDRAEKIALLAEVFGAAAVGWATRLMKPKAIVLLGQSAENGKSAVLDAMRGLLPPEAVASLPPSKFSDERLTCELVGKLLNAADELSSAAAIGSDAFKGIVTGEPTTARQVYQRAVTFRPVALHAFATNSLPSFVGGFDRGVQRRLVVISFNRIVPQDERVEHIGARIAAEESDLLLAFAVEGAARLIARRYFAEPASCKTALGDWIFGADPVLAWFADRSVFEAGNRLSKKEAYADFKGWALGEGYDQKRLPAVSSFVLRVTAQDTRIKSARNNSIGRYFINLKLADKIPEEFKSAGSNIFDEKDPA